MTVDTIDPELSARLQTIFLPLDKKAVLPSRGALADALSVYAKKAQVSHKQKNVVKVVSPSDATFFATAAVEMWERAVHSFLISSALTTSSPIWSSVSGYYASHYAVRAIAHLLGFFHLHNDHKLVRLIVRKHRYECEFTCPKKEMRREHSLYWVLVKENELFASDPLFTANKSDSTFELSDQDHRGKVNYSDHVFNFPDFEPLDKDFLKERIDRISQLSFHDTPQPRLSEFPDVEYVQVVAYHRIVRFRQMLDEILGGKNKFWNEHRNPSFARDYMDFQLIGDFKLDEMK